MDMLADKKFVKWHWGYVIILCKFVILVLDSGIAKSFGVLIPEMVTRLKSNYATVGFICSLPSTLAYFSCPAISVVLEKVNHRLVAIAGALTASVCMVLCALVSDVVLMGVFLALTGIGFACDYMTSVLMLNDYFPEKFVLMNSLTMYGFTIGATFLPLITERSREAYGLFGSYIILGGITCNVIVCAVALRKPIKNQGVQRSHPQDKRDPHTLDEKGKNYHMKGVEKRINDGTQRTLTHPTACVTEHVTQETRCPSEAPETANLAENETRETACNVEYETRETASNAKDGMRMTAPSDVETQANMSAEDVRSGLVRKELELDKAADMPFSINKTRKQITQSDPSSNINTPTLQETQISDLPWYETVRRLLLLDEKVLLLSIPIFSIYCYVLGSWMLFLVPHAEQLGIPESRAVLLSTIGGIGGVVGRTVFIISVSKNTNAFSLYIVAGTILSMTFLLDFIGSSFFVRAGLAFVQGFCLFIGDNVCFTLVKSGVRNQTNFGRATGLLLFFNGLGVNSAGYGTGYLFDLTHSYTTVFTVIGVLHSIMVVNIIIAMILLKGRPSDAI